MTQKVKQPTGRMAGGRGEGANSPGAVLRGPRPPMGYSQAPAGLCKEKEGVAGSHPPTASADRGSPTTRQLMNHGPSLCRGSRVSSSFAGQASSPGQGCTPPIRSQCPALRRSSGGCHQPGVNLLRKGFSTRGVQFWGVGEHSSGVVLSY